MTMNVEDFLPRRVVLKGQERRQLKVREKSDHLLNTILIGFDEISIYAPILASQRRKNKEGRVPELPKAGGFRYFESSPSTSIFAQRSNFQKASLSPLL